jgi:glutathione synthase/RimK-type ligase-like ATP-grasp enzyme
VIVVVAPADDLPAITIRYEAERAGIACEIVDFASFPGEASLTLEFGRGSDRIILDSGRRWLELQGVTGIWLRRLERHRVPPDLPLGLEQFVVNETRQALLGALAAAWGRAMNPLGANLQANVKPRQLHAAREAGLAIPETLVTNNVEEAKRFLERQTGRVIFKILSGAPFGSYETRVLDQDATEFLDRLPAAPAFFQPLVPGAADIRATVVDAQVFAVEADFGGRDVVDGRLESIRSKPHRLPDGIAQSLVRLCRSLGLVYGAVDLRYDPVGGYTFFEVNPTGQYLWTEIETGLPITRAIMRWLADLAPEA